MPACLRPVRRPKKCVRAEPQAQPTPGAPWWSGYSIEMCEFILVGEECPRRGRGCGYAHTQEERTLAEAACRRTVFFLVDMRRPRGFDHYTVYSGRAGEL